MSLKRGIFYTFLTQAPTLLFYFVSSTLMTRILGDEGRGAFALLQNQVVLITMLFSFSIGFGITYFVSKEQGDPRRMVRVSATLLTMNLLLVPLIVSAIYFIPALQSIFMPEEVDHWGYYVYVVISVIGTQVTGFIGAIMLGLKRFRILNQAGMLNAGLSAIAFLILYTISESIDQERILASVVMVSLSYGLIMLLVWCIIYIKVVGILPTPVWDWSILRPVFLFVMTTHLGNIINLLNYRFDVWVVGSYAGSAQLGLYAVAVGVGQLCFYIPEPFSKVVQPYLYGQTGHAMLEKFKFIQRLNFTTVFVLLLCMAIVAPWVFPLLFGEVFADSVAPLWWLLPGILFVSASKLLGPLVVQGGFIRFNLYASGLAASTTILLGLLLIPHWGIIGAAFVSSVAYIVQFAVQCAIVRFRMKITLKDMFFLQSTDFVRIRALIGNRLPFLSK